ncbi:hypothetical protein [Streptomyces sp. NPDC086989]|uniref:hypothetical protein n=1 Tax=Streptomyces sp. NPDC086989 TaxID=3365764 RepID=UPI00381C25F9
MSDGSIITVEIRGLEPAAVEAAARVSDLFFSRGPCRPRRIPGVDEVIVLVYADVSQRAGGGGYPAPEASDSSATDLR